jgi:hypothetical protein
MTTTASADFFDVWAHVSKSSVVEGVAIACIHYRHDGGGRRATITIVIASLSLFFLCLSLSLSPSPLSFFLLSLSLSLCLYLSLSVSLCFYLSLSLSYVYVCGLTPLIPVCCMERAGKRAEFEDGGVTDQREKKKKKKKKKTRGRKFTMAYHKRKLRGHKFACCYTTSLLPQLGQQRRRRH